MSVPADTMTMQQFYNDLPPVVPVPLMITSDSDTQSANVDMRHGGLYGSGQGGVGRWPCVWFWH